MKGNETTIKKGGESGERKYLQKNRLYVNI